MERTVQFYVCGDKFYWGVASKEVKDAKGGVVATYCYDMKMARKAAEAFWNRRNK